MPGHDARAGAKGGQDGHLPGLEEAARNREEEERTKLRSYTARCAETFGKTSDADRKKTRLSSPIGCCTG